MNVSSVSAPTPVTPLDAGASKSQDVTTSSDGGDADATHEPPAPPPLPPGQGTRIDQLA